MGWVWPRLTPPWRRTLPRLVPRHGLTTDLPVPRLEPLQHESWFKRRQSVLQGLPGVIDRQQQPPIAEVLDGHFAAAEAVVLGQSHGLIAARLEQSRRVHERPPR
jgi:hypothetical protein